MKSTRRYYITLLLLVFLFATPGLSAYFLYFHPSWLSAATTNKGQFIKPPILLETLGASVKWRLILWSPESCETTCMEQLDKLKRVRLALGRRLYDVDLNLLLGPNAGPLSEPVAKMLHEPGMSVITLTVGEAMHLSPRYPHSELFIANPEHYLVLAYPLTAEPDDLFHDIKLLLLKGN